jgi:DNA invertase Pin-like site-specific DNA recombinase
MNSLRTGSKINSTHLARKAIVYVRQSTRKQVRHNQESQRLQYALTDRATDLGFGQVEVIDKDLGISASLGARQRPGFQQLLSSVALGDVGMILSRELSRLSRTDKDWCHLMEVCQIFDTLLGDEEGIYDTNTVDDQLILGIKGTISVAELNVLKLRMQQGKDAKARRGELYCAIAPGYVRDGAELVIDPNKRVQDAIRLIFSKFNELKTVRQTYIWFMDNHIEVPVNKSLAAKSGLVWKLPAQTFIPSVLHNPIYAGAYVYGRRPIEKVLEDGRIRRRQQAIQPPEKAKVFIKSHHEGYISWETYQQNQKMIDQNGSNFQTNPETLAIRKGQGLLTGLLRCSRCGRKLTVRYWGKSGTHPRYHCQGDYTSAGSYCIGFAGKGSDDAVAEKILEVISGKGVEASLAAIEECNAHKDDKHQALQRQLEQLSYEAQRAFNQYDQADPANRLVVDTLEQRWNEKLETVEVAQQALNAIAVAPTKLNEKDQQKILMLGKHFKETWHHPDCPMRLKKQIVRLLIKEVMVDLVQDDKRLNFIIHWHGGSHSAFSIERPMSACTLHRTADGDVEIITKMAALHSDAEIAMVLGKLGRKTGKGNRWTSSRVAVARRKYCKNIQNKSNENQLTIVQAQNYCGVSGSTIHRLIEAKLLKGEQVVPYAPYAINKSDLDCEPVLTIIKHLKKTGILVLDRGILDKQENLFQ